MKIKPLLVVGALATIAQLAIASPLLPNDRTTILTEIESIRNASNNDDYGAISNLTFEPLINMAGGRAAFVEVIKQSLTMVKASGLEILSSRSLEPSEVLDAGEYEACVIPEENIMKFKELRLRDRGFTIALRKKGTNEWRLFGGAGLRRNPQLLNMLVPNFPSSFQFPKNGLERLP